MTVVRFRLDPSQRPVVIDGDAVFSVMDAENRSDVTQIISVSGEKVLVRGTYLAVAEALLGKPILDFKS